MQQRSGTERAMGEMEAVMRTSNGNAAYSNLSEGVEREARNLSSVAVQVEAISKKVGRDVVDNLLSDIFQNGNVMNAVQRNTSVSKLTQYIIDDMELGIMTDGFEKRTVHVGESLCTYYCRDPIQVIKKQLSMVEYADFRRDPQNRSGEPNAVYSGLGQQAYHVVRDMIELSEEADVRWYEEEVDGQQSAIAFLKLYSDKSKTTMKVSGLTFYPLHVNIMNLSESTQNMLCSHGHTLVAFLPVEFKHVLSLIEAEHISLSRLDRMKNVHYVIGEIMKPLSYNEERGIHCKTVDGHSIRLHMVLGSYIADIPEQKDMVCVKYSNRTKHPCPRCHVQAQELKRTTLARLRTLQETRRIIS